MNISRIQMMIILLVSWVCIVTAQFVAQPKKKTVSAAKVKEQCAQELGNQLEHFARIMRLLGTVQERVLEHTYALLENDKEIPLHQKNGSDLSDCHTRMCAFNKSLATMEKELQEYALFVSELK